MRSMLRIGTLVVVLLGGMVAVNVPAAGAATFTVTSSADTTAVGTLRWAVGQANANGESDTIVIDPAVGSIVVAGTVVQHTAAHDLTIQGNGVSIARTGPSGILSNSGTGELTITDAAFVGVSSGALPAVGGAGDVTLERVDIRQNTTNGNDTPAAGVVAGGHLTLVDSTLAQNGNAAGPGQEVAGGAWAASATVTDSTIVDNSATGASSVVGGVYTDDGDVTITGSTITGNDAFATGHLAAGAVSAAGGLSVSGTSVIDNTAASTGTEVGGLLAIGNVTITGSTIASNDATGASTVAPSAGGVAGGDVTVTDTLVADNSSIVGGGIYSTGSTALVRSTVSDNVATDFDGAGVYSEQDVTVTNSTVSGNTVEGTMGSYGGGIHANDAVTLVHATVVENEVVSQQGANIGAATLTAYYSVIALPQSAAARGNCYLFVGTIASSSSWSDDGSCGLVGTGDVQNGGDPHLGALDTNGGATPTRLPQAGSPLLDAIPNSSCDPSVTTDQRGFARPGGAGTACDIGAVEVPSSPTVCPATTQSSMTGGALLGAEWLVVAVPFGIYAAWRRRRGASMHPMVTMFLLAGAAVTVLAACQPAKVPPPLC